MIKPSDFYEELKKNELDFYCGVPDSLLASFCAYVHDFSDKNNHIKELEYRNGKKSQ